VATGARRCGCTRSFTPGWKSAASRLARTSSEPSTSGLPAPKAVRRQNDGVVFGSTIPGQGVKHGRLARKALQLYNREGITNLEDDLADLERVLANEFSEHHVETRGSFALFVARR
jgi:hypothetical protein